MNLSEMERTSLIRLHTYFQVKVLLTAGAKHSNKTTIDCSGFFVVVFTMFFLHDHTPFSFSNRYMPAVFYGSDKNGKDTWRAEFPCLHTKSSNFCNIEAASQPYTTWCEPWRPDYFRHACKGVQQLKTLSAT